MTAAKKERNYGTYVFGDRFAGSAPPAASELLIFFMDSLKMPLLRLAEKHLVPVPADVQDGLDFYESISDMRRIDYFAIERALLLIQGLFWSYADTPKDSQTVYAPTQKVQDHFDKFAITELDGDGVYPTSGYIALALFNFNIAQKEFHAAKLVSDFGYSLNLWRSARYAALALNDLYACDKTGMMGRAVGQNITGIIGSIVKPWSEAANWMARQRHEDDVLDSSDLAGTHSIEGEYCARLNEGKPKKKKKVTPRGPIKKQSLAKKAATKKKPGSK
jgi:hypothetical protein